jgi:hypothetical protein
MPPGFTTMPSGGGASSPMANNGRSRWTSGTGVWLDSPLTDWGWWRCRRWCRRAAAARPQRRSRLGLGSGDHRRNAGQHVAVGASLGPRGGVEELGWQRQRAEGQLHRGGGNGMRRGGARAGRGRAPFHMCGDVEGERGSRLEGRAQEFKARHATAEVHRVSPTGGAAGGGGGFRPGHGRAATHGF